MVFLAVALCKALYFIGSRVGKGSSLPGQIALKLFPGALRRLRLPPAVIAVTGSNGKTSTAEYIAAALAADGMRVGRNHEGSNQIEGVATLLFRIASFDGVIRYDALVLECDERFACRTFESVKPTIIVVTNLCRDQLSRNGHPEFIRERIRAAIATARAPGAGGASALSGTDGMDGVGGGALLVLNADDPYVASLAAGRALWFGIANPGAGGGRDSGVAELPGCEPYDDGLFCPVCKSRMAYDYRVAGHYGAYRCDGCGLLRPAPDLEAEIPNAAADRRAGPDAFCEPAECRMIMRGGAEESSANVPQPAGAAGEVAMRGGAEDGRDGQGGQDGSVFPVRVPYPLFANAYNIAASMLAATAAGVGVGSAAAALDGYSPKSGRVMRLSVEGKSIALLASKHENSLSYNQSLSYAASGTAPRAVLILVDSISRKYYTSETSWLWDVNFDLLGAECVKSVILAGRYVNELAARFSMSRVDAVKCSRANGLADIREQVERCGTDHVFAITCFADKAKLLKALAPFTLM